MKRENIKKASELSREIEKLERQLDSITDYPKARVVLAGDEYDLEDFPAPSRIGDCFRAVKTAVVHMLEFQIAGLKAELAALGATDLEPKKC